MEKQNFDELNSLVREQFKTTARELRNTLVIKVALLIFIVGYFSTIYYFLHHAKITGRTIPVYFSTEIQKNMPGMVNQLAQDAPKHMDNAHLLIKKNIPVVAANLKKGLETMPQAVAPQIENEISVMLTEKIGDLKKRMQRERPNDSDEELFNELVSLKPGAPLREQVIMPVFDRNLGPLNDLNRQMKTLSQNQATDSSAYYQKNLVGAWIKLVKLTVPETLKQPQ